jgi:outer membrane protein insertion porin family
VIANVDFVGLKEFDKDVLLKSLKDAGIGEGLPFDRALVDRAEQEIKRQYLSRSLYGAEVVTTITPVERNRVNVTFTMTEGDAARISDIRIVGAKVFTESTLLGLFELTHGRLADLVHQVRPLLARQAQRRPGDPARLLREPRLPRVRGRVDAGHDLARQAGHLDRHLHPRGPALHGHRRALEGDYLGKEDEFRSLVRIRPGQAYRGDATWPRPRACSPSCSACYGYAFARVEPQPEIDRATGRWRWCWRRTAAPRLRAPHRRGRQHAHARRGGAPRVPPARVVLVRRRPIKLSRDRVDRLGYFSEVDVETNEVPGAPDQVDLVVNVTEKPTGNLLLGAGFSSADKLSLTASIKQDNVFGSGNYLGIEVNTSRQPHLVFSTVDPYFTIDGVSRAIDLFYRTSRPSTAWATSTSSPRRARRSASACRSPSSTPCSSASASSAPRSAPPPACRTATSCTASCSGQQQRAAADAGLGARRRDSALVPTSGPLPACQPGVEPSSATCATCAPTCSTSSTGRCRRLTLGLNAELGIGKGLGGKPYPVFKNFYGGGLGTVRVFEQGSLGVIDPTGAYIGGSRKFNVNAELYFPVPGSGNDKTLRIFAFADAGNVWREREKVTASIRLRSSVGLGLSWISPVGRSSSAGAAGARAAQR